MVSIRALSVSDYDDWLEVYRVYAEHYQSELTEEGVSTTWNWLMDNENPLTGIVADFEGKLIGLAHFRALPNRWLLAAGGRWKVEVRSEEKGGN